MRKRLASLLTICLISVGLLVTHFNRTQPAYGGGFVRLTGPVLKPIANFTIPSPRGYIAGIVPPFLYIADPSSPDSLTRVEVTMLQNPVTLTIRPEVNTTTAVVRVTDAGVWSFDPEGRNVWRRTFDHRPPKLFADADLHPDVVPIGTNSLATRTFSRNYPELVLSKRGASEVSLKPGILEKQVDGVFCTDGKLLHDPTTSRLFYIYFYRNQFIAMDTNLSVQYRGRTIDTVSHARVRSARMKSDSSLALASPQALVNRNATASSRWLVVHSNIRGDNDDKDHFRSHSALDFYSAENGQYEFSCFVPRFRNTGLSDFRIVENRLLAQHGPHLVLYEIIYRE